MTEKIIARMNVMARRCSGWMLPACLLVASHIRALGAACPGGVRAD